MDTSKVIRGVVNSGRYTVTAPIVKEDYGLYLQIEGVELPSTYEVDFSNSESSGTSVTMIGNSDGVLIPRQFIDTGKDIFAFLYHVGADFGRTVYKFRIPNKVRPDRTNEEPTPEEQSVIDQAISALNTAVAQTAQDVIDADASAQSAHGYAEQAETARDTAQGYSNNAQLSATQANNSAISANQSASDALTSANTASAKAQDASQSATTASQKATESAQSASQALTYKTDAENAKTASQTAQTGAEQARNEASQIKTDVQNIADGIDTRLTDVEDALAEKAPVITDTASGAIASFSDGADNLPLKSLVVNIDPVQDLSNGDPSPENICPISGWTEVDVEQRGKNLLSPNFSDYTTSNNYAFMSDVVKTGQIARFTLVDKDTSVDISGCSIGFQVGISTNRPATAYRWAVDNGTIRTNMTNVSSNGTICTGVFIYPKTEETFNKIFSRWYVMIEFGSTATPYSPYTGRSITINLGQTVYGGKLDVLSGELTVDRAMLTVTECLSVSTASTGVLYASVSVATGTIAKAEASLNKNISSIYKYRVNAPTDDGWFRVITNAIYIYDNRFTDKATVDTILSTEQPVFVYELATPITIQLTPNQVNSLLGVNNIWADSGDTTCVYRADTKAWIQRKIAEAIASLT